MYSIGQVIYIISNKNKTIEPVQVHSKQTLESFDGTKVKHICTNTKNKQITLEEQSEAKLLAGVFTTLEDAEAHLLSLASKMVKALAEDAREKSTLFTPRESEAPSLPLETLSDSDVHTVTLDDGTKARLHLPQELS